MNIEGPDITLLEQGNTGKIVLNQLMIEAYVSFLYFNQTWCNRGA